jgi:hypothetical protein
MVHLSTIGPLAINVDATRLPALSQRACAALLYLVVMQLTSLRSPSG